MRPFRFGVVGAPRADGAAWRATAARVAELGYSSLLVPDGMQLLSPFTTLATAAAVTNLRVGTFVLAAPLRPPLAAAWEAHSLSALTDGRFDFGIGTGLPTTRSAAERLGLPFGSAAERLGQVAETIEQLRVLDGDARTPILMAAAGPRARDLAARTADIVTPATGPLTPREEVAALVADVRDRAGDRAGDLEFAMNLFAVGDEMPSWIERFVGTDADTLIAQDSLTILRGSVDEMTDELRRRRDRIGISYILVNVDFCQQLAPVVERLAGE
jgi:alkanesulfonate monooxygenase SsuD/methylene tetrahydromethanopterin reductase-like flavin-dependent oxidoreductase (luciferase family)